MLNGVNSLADELFAEKPAVGQEDTFDPHTGAHRYVQSRVFSGSRGLHPDNQAVPQRLSEEAIADKIMHIERLGPYERQLLASLLRAPHSLVIVAGSTGSGKTSTLRNVCHFYDTHARLNEARVVLGWNPKHAYVDFNKLDKEYETAQRSQPGSGLDLLYEKVPTRILQALFKSVREVAVKNKSLPTQVVLELARDAYKWVVSEEEVPGGLSFDWPDLFDIGRPNLTGNPDRDIQELQSNLARKAAHRKRSNIPLLFWCAILDALAIKSRPTGKSTLLVLDNIDPLPDETQLALRDEFIGLCLDRNFKTILALRHSTVRVHRQGPVAPRRPRHTVEYSWYPHCGPNPVEIVCSRLLGFLAKPDSYPSFNDLNQEWKQRTLYRALDLLLRLTRGGPHYRVLGQLALAGAGDSVRRAVQTIRFMFENNELSFEYSTVDAITAIKQLSVELRTISCSSSLGLALREEIIGMAMECSDLRSAREAVESATGRLKRTVRSVLQGSFDQPDGWCNSRADKLWQHPEVRGMLIEDVETAAALLHERIVSLGIASADASRMRAALADSLSVELLALCPDKAKHAGFDELVASIVKSLSNDHRERGSGKDDGADFSFSWDRLRICTNALSTNRSYVMARSLIRAGHLHNLFVDSCNEPSLLPLTLLYYLAFQDDGETSLAIVLKLIRAEASEEEALDLLNLLCSRKGRVIWINQEFLHDSYDELVELAKLGARVKLTHGGWAYYLGVLDEIDYIMETLWEPARGVRDELLSKRLDSTLNQLDRMLNLKPAQGHEREPLWPAIQKGVVADLIVRCTPGLIRAVRGHFAKMQSDHTTMPRDSRLVESHRTREVMIAWVRLMEKAKSRACSGAFAEARLSPARNAHLLPLGRVGQYRGLGPVAGACHERWRNAMNDTENLLRGPDLWAPNLDPDAYHARAEHGHSEMDTQTVLALTATEGASGGIQDMSGQIE